MGIMKIVLGLLCTSLHVYAMQGVSKQINKVIKKIRTSNNYDAKLIPAGFDENEWGTIVNFKPTQQCAFTHIANVYHYDTTIKDGQYIGWHCIHQKASNVTPNNFAQSFNTAHSLWKDHIAEKISENIYPNFIYNHATQTCIFSIYKYPRNVINQPINHVNYFSTLLIIKHNNNEQVIDIKRKEEFLTIDEIACRSDGQYCAYLLNSYSNKLNSHFFYSSLKILKRLSNGLYDNVNDDTLTQGNSIETKEFQLIYEKHPFKTTDLHFLPNNSISLQTITSDNVYVWNINVEGIKTKQQCFIDCGNKQLLPLNIFTFNEKISESQYRYRINDPRFSSFVISNAVQIHLLKEIWGKITTIWYDIDPILREKTTLIYDNHTLSEEKKIKL